MGINPFMKTRQNTPPPGGMNDGRASRGCNTFERGFKGFVDPCKIF